MTTRATIAVQSNCSSTLAALQNLIVVEEAIEPEFFQKQDDLYLRLEQWIKRMAREKIDGYILGISSTDDWTVIEETQKMLPADAKLLQSISEKLGTTVAGMILQTTSGSHGLILCINGQVV